MARRLALVVPRKLPPINPMANTISRVRAKSRGFEGWADDFLEVWMCQEMGAGSFLVSKDLREQGGTTTGNVGTEAISSDEFDG